MKTIRHLIAITAILCSSLAFSQCPVGVVTFENQSEVDDFGTAYPSCTTINGDLTFKGSNFTNLEALSNITAITGNLTLIDGFSGINDWYPLSNLTAIGGLDVNSAFVSSLPTLNNITTIDHIYINEASGISSVYFPDITTVNAHLKVSGNNNLTSISLPSLMTVGSYFHLESNENLTAINFTNLVSSGSYLQISLNSSLTNLSGFSKLTTLGESLYITNNPSLTDIIGLNNLVTVNETVEIAGNNSLTSLVGLDNVNPALLGYLALNSNANLTTCSLHNLCTYLSNGGLNLLTGNAVGCSTPSEVATACICPLGNITFHNQTELDNFAINYPNCTTIEGNVTFTGGPYNNMDAFSNFTTITGSLTFYDLSSAIDWSGLDNLSTLNGNLTFAFNHMPWLPDLASLSVIGGNFGYYILDTPGQEINVVFDNITKINGNLMIEGFYVQSFSMPLLTSVEGDFTMKSISAIAGVNFLNLTTVTGKFGIIGNQMLTNLSGFSNLTSVGGLALEYLMNVGGFNDLTNLVTVNGPIDITGNNSITSLNGLQNINPAFITNLTVSFNRYLQTCNIPPLCTYLAGPGPRTLWDNRDGCDTDAEIAAKCLTNCPSGNVVLTTQSQVDDFVTNNPYCTGIAGDLQISGSAITNLNGLANIKSITGNVTIQNDLSSLTNWNGLNNVSSIGGSLRIINTNLSTLPSFNNLTTLGGFNYANNTGVGNISFNTVTAVNGDLQISGNSTLTVFSMSSLTTVSGDFSIDNNSVLAHAGFNNLATIAGDFTVSANGVLTDLSGFPTLASINGNLSILDNSLLADISDLSNLIIVNGILQIENNNSLIILNGLENVDPALLDHLVLQSNTGLASCDLPNFCTYLSGAGLRTITGNAVGCASVAEIAEACLICPSASILFTTQSEVDTFAIAHPACTTISGDVTINGAGITNLDALSNITTITGSLHLQNLTALNDWSGFDNLSTLDGTLEITNSNFSVLPTFNSLTTIGGDFKYESNTGNSTISFTNITTINGEVTINSPGMTSFTMAGLSNVGSNFNIQGNETLTTVAFSSLSSVGGNFSLSDNDVLTALNFAGLSSVDGNFDITTNAVLADISTFNNLTTVEGSLIVRGNDALTSLSGLDSINPGLLAGLTLDSNVGLATCTLPNLCTYIGSGHIATISGNAVGCSTPAEVATNCGLTCPTGNLIVTSQAEIDSFLLTFPSCTTISGDLQISGAAITNLNGFLNLTAVTNAISVSNAPLLTSLSGLDNLTSTGKLTISSTGLFTTTELSSLTTIGGNFEVIGNPAMSSIILDVLTTLGGDLNIGDNASLDTVYSYLLSTVGGQVYIHDNQAFNSFTFLALDTVNALVIENNLVLSNLSGFQALTSINGSLEIRDNPLLNDISGLGQVLTVQNTIDIDNNAALTNLSGIDGVDPYQLDNLLLNSNVGLSNCNLQNLCIYLANGGAVTISGNAVGCSTTEELSLLCVPCPNNIDLTSQADVDDFGLTYSHCTTIDGVLYINGLDIDNLNGLSNITTVTDYIDLSETPLLTSLSGLENLTSAGGLYIYYEPNLSDISALANLSEIQKNSSPGGNIQFYGVDALSVINLPLIDWIPGFFDISSNPLLTTLSAPGLMGVGRLSIEANPVLTTAAFAQLVDVDGYLYMKDNALTDMSGFNSLTYVNGYLSISNHPALTSVTGLNNLTSINGHIRIENNDALISLSGLDNVDPSMITNLYLNNSDNLAVCNIPASLCTYLANGGNATITNNSNGCNSIDEVLYSCELNCAAGTIWNGNSWSNGLPDDSTAVTITGNYTSDSDLSGCSLTVTNNADVVIMPGDDLYVKGKIDVQSGTLTFENNANLLQYPQTVPNQNLGNITYKRNALMRRLDYVFWGSPVLGQNLLNFSQQTITNRFYTLDETANNFAPIDPSLNDFIDAHGYMIRAPNTFTATPAAFEGIFKGPPNNGSYSVPVTNSGSGFNLIGNPYPSPIDANSFLAANPGTLYFWTHSTQTPGAGTNYATYTTFGPAASAGVELPNGFIQAGQGFLLRVAGDGDAIFTNNMRSGNNDGQFFRGAANSEKHRIWLNLSAGNVMMNQALVGYMAGATPGVDTSIDGLMYYDGSSISSIINGSNYSIQALALPFSDTDVIPLHFKAETSGTFTIGIDHVDGIFETNQDIFIKDDLLGITHNIKSAPYTFVAESGATASRFSVVFQNVSLGIENPVFDAEGVIIFKNENLLHITSGIVEMADIKVYDIRSRLIFEQKDINKNKVILHDLKAEHGVLLVQVTSSDKRTVTKKVVL